MRSPWSVLTTRGKAFFVLGLVVAVAGVFLGYEDVTRIGLLLVALPVLAYLLVPRRTPKIKVVREVDPARLVPDQRGAVEVGFTNVGKRRTPIYLAEEHLDYQLGDRPRFVLPRLAPGEDRRLRYAVRSRHRGAFPLGPVLLRQRDPFGLTFLALQLSSRAEVLVLPRTFDLGEDRVPGTSRGSEGEMPQMVALHGEDDVSIRTWRDGDELRRVHWPATAHRGELMVRQEDRPARRRALLILDSRAAAHPGSGVRASYEWAVSAIASVGRHLAAQGFVLHLLSDTTLSDGTAEHPIEVDQMLTALARVQPVQDSRLDRLSASAEPFTSGGVLVVAAVVAHDDQDLRALAAIHQPGSRALAFVLDPEKFGAEKSGTERSGAGTAKDASRHDVTGVLAEAGWRTVVCGPHTEIPLAWSAVSGARSLSRSA